MAGQKPFYIGLGVVGLAGAVFLVSRVMGGGSVAIPANVAVTTADTAGFRGYVLGAETAPVEVVEYADFQCPVCADFDALTFGDLKTRLIDAGKARFVYRDYPLEQHRHARVAAHAAACANDEGKFWQAKEAIYRGQNDWAYGNDAMDGLTKAVTSAGVDQAAWTTCMKSAKYAGRIQASFELANQVGVGQTPTFLIDGKLYPGKMPGDMMVKLVDSLIAAKAAAPATSPAQ